MSLGQEVKGHLPDRTETARKKKTDSGLNHFLHCFTHFHFIYSLTLTILYFMPYDSLLKYTMQVTPLIPMFC